MRQKYKLKPVALGLLLAGCAVAATLSGCAAHTTAYQARKVTVCHKGKTLVIPDSALQAHLGHGDERGACG